ncbi:ABC transporter ATP-binding protein [Nonomuraea sp. KC401]|uniref:ABC transporter ATP-binding protein n=1 Tax=unclassified Nonomuraea TaxID=2593643 RepID=UPI0010FD1E22|nr:MULTISPECIES: ABC transporter ATP-binding protein [unclassified Nonomuraea]NBE97367.1 ATP-binding cassette domain-containing protein [Nonomuraea sp. K271]TLF62399.1 ABC transporter ATP-binding protein [Nonomuraea sp. KC401]
MSLLSVRNLVIDYAETRALDGADLDVAPGEKVGLVGESGSGKSTLGSAVGRLLPRTARRTGGEVLVAGEPVFDLPPAGLRRLRRRQLGFVFQDPIGSLDPTMRVGAQLRLVLGRGADVNMHLERVRLDDPRVARAYPHQLSGGMAQRVAVAMAMATSPELLVADEPTAALDSQVREEVLNVVFSLAADAGTSLLWLSHDLPAVARRCDRIAVMYGGRVVEHGPAREVLGKPAHPYTAALAGSAPAAAAHGARLEPVPGRPPVLTGPSPGCAFAPRCALAVDRCHQERPGPVRVRHQDVLCHRAGEVTA